MKRVNGYCESSHRVKWRAPRSFLGALTCAGIIVASVIGNANAQTAGDPPAADEIYWGCEFDLTALQDALTLEGASGLAGGLSPPTRNLQATYILIYVRQNQNDGQALSAGGYTGPVLCINDTGATIDKVTEATPIPEGGGFVDLLGLENVTHLQYRDPATTGDIKKRVCHTVGSTTDCFSVEP